MKLKIGYYYFPYIKNIQKRDDKYEHFDTSCVVQGYSSRFYTYLLENLEQMLHIGGMYNVQYDNWVKLSCTDIQKTHVIKTIKVIDFWFEDYPPLNIPVLNFYRTTGTEKHENKITTYNIIKKHYGETEVKSLPKYFFIDQSDMLSLTIADTEELAIIQVIKHALEILKTNLSKEQLKAKPAWLLKDANSSIGEGIFGFYLLDDEELIINKFVKQIKDYFEIPENKEHYKKLSNVFYRGFYGEPEWMICEFIDSIRVPSFPENNLMLSNIKHVWDPFLKNARLKFRAYFCPIVEYDSTNNFKKNTFGWLCPFLDVDYMKSNIEIIKSTISNNIYENKLYEDIWDRSNIISNLVSGQVQTEIQKYLDGISMIDVDEQITNEVFKSVREDGVDYVMAQIKEICRNVILPEFEIGCLNDPINYTEDVKQHVKISGKNFKCFNVNAIDLIVDKDLNVFFLELNTSPVVQKTYPPIVYGGLYDVAIDNKHNNHMIYQNQEYLPSVAQSIQEPITIIQNNVKDQLLKSDMLINPVKHDETTQSSCLTFDNVEIFNGVLELCKIDNIVNAVIQNEFSKEKLISNKIKINMFDEDDTDSYGVYVDKKRQYKAISTELITNTFLESQTKQNNFIYLVTSMFQSALKQYCTKKNISGDSILFIFKGGMALRILYKKYTHQTNGLISDMLDKLFGMYFKKSDADFEIVIDPNLQDFDKIKEEITNISYLVLNKIRYIMSSHIDNYLDFYKYNLPNQMRILTRTLKAMQSEIDKDIDIKNQLSGSRVIGVYFNNLVTFKDMNYTLITNNENASKFYSDAENISQQIYNKIQKHDFVVTKDKAGKDITYDVERIHNNKIFDKSLLNADNIFQKYVDKFNLNDMYISYNDALKFSSNDKVFSFNLVRLKMNFKYILEKNNKKYMSNIPGEMIDVAIIDKTQFGIKELFENKQKNISSLTFKNDDENPELLSQTFTTNVFSIEYFCEELEAMLFYKYAHPWKLEKYKKRLFRLLFLYSVDIFKVFKSVETLNVYIDKVISTYKIISARQSTYITKIENLLQETDDSENCNKCMSIRTFHKLNIELIKNNIGTKITETSEFIEYYNEILNFFSNVKLLINSLETHDMSNLDIFGANMSSNLINMNIYGGNRVSIPLEKFY